MSFKKIAKAITGGLGGWMNGISRNEAESKKFEEAGKNVKNVFSDVFLKDIYGDSLDDRILDDFARLSAIDFRYKDEAQSEYGCDDRRHTGVIAQDLESTPSTESTVIEGPDGVKMVDTAQLTMADTAAISEMAREIKALKEMVQKLGARLGGND